MKHLNIRIDGSVQGVSFRFEAQRQAAALGIKGFVKNQPDGSVYIEAEGDQQQLNEFLKWCRKGPTLARVTNIEQEEAPMKNFKEFDIRF